MTFRTNQSSHHGTFCCLLLSSSLLFFGMGVGTGFGLFHTNGLNLVAPFDFPQQQLLVVDTPCPMDTPCPECLTCPSYLPPPSLHDNIRWKREIQAFSKDLFPGTFHDFFFHATNLSENCIERVKSLVEKWTVYHTGEMMLSEFIPFSSTMFSHMIKVYVTSDLGDECPIDLVVIGAPTMGSLALAKMQEEEAQRMRNDVFSDLKRQVDLFSASPEVAKLLAAKYNLFTSPDLMKAPETELSVKTLPEEAIPSDLESYPVRPPTTTTTTETP